jgi:Conjugative transposon protein TcpC
MVRMSKPSDKVRLSAYAGDLPAAVPVGGAGTASAYGDGTDPARRSGALTRRGAWSGAGGRWLLWPLRAVLWAGILIVAYRGFTAIVFDGASPRDRGTPAAASSAPFPVTLAEAYTLAFGQVYLNFTPRTQAQREQQLAAFMPPALAAANPDLGWNGAGQAHLDSEQVAGVTVRDSQHAVVNLLATVDGQLMELGVPVFASGQSVVVSGTPAWLAAPPPISPPARGQLASDPVVQAQLANQLPAFFQAYANGSANALSRFLAPGAVVPGLGGAVAFGGIRNLVVPPGGGTRDITVDVVWQVLGQNGVSAAKLNMTYCVSVVDLQSGKWYVKGISAATEAVGSQ